MLFSRNMVVYSSHLTSLFMILVIQYHGLAWFQNSSFSAQIKFHIQVMTAALNSASSPCWHVRYLFSSSLSVSVFFHSWWIRDEPISKLFCVSLLLCVWLLAYFFNLFSFVALTNNIAAICSPLYSILLSLNEYFAKCFPHTRQDVTLWCSVLVFGVTFWIMLSVSFSRFITDGHTPFVRFVVYFLVKQ